jgi:hypothetical protein
MTTRSLIADLFAAVERAEERLKETTQKRSGPTEECLESSVCFPQPERENRPDIDSIAQTRANIDRYWRNHFGKVGLATASSAGGSSGTTNSESE